jgi:hypothetical protein
MFLNLFFRQWLALSTLCVISCVPSIAQVDSVPVAAIDSGSISGSHYGPKAQEVMFLGIPYAAPPTGDRRWKPPGPVEGWKGIRKADAFAPACPHPATFVTGQANEAKELSQSLPYYREFQTALTPVATRCSIQSTLPEMRRASLFRLPQRSGG